jgi:hypothetical protein
LVWVGLDNLVGIIFGKPILRLSLTLKFGLNVRKVGARYCDVYVCARHATLCRA